MKKILTAFFLYLVCYTSFSQIPSQFKYQAVIHNTDGTELDKKNVSLRISLLQDSSSGPIVYSETHLALTNSFGLVNLSIGGGTLVSGSITNIDWSAGPYFIKTELDASGGSNFSLMGINQLLAVPFALYSNKTNTKATFEINGTSQLSSDSALFEVKDKNGNIVFAVYEDGVQVIVNLGVKGSRGGFAVGGRTSVKGTVIEDIMRVTPDSVRIYLNNSIVKGSRSGFAVGGRTPTKGKLPQYLIVTQDSSRIFTADSISGFGIGSLNGSSTLSYMHLNPFNYFIGQQSGQSVVLGTPNWYSGKYNATFGFQSGMSITTGAYNLLLGYKAGFFNTTGFNNTAAGAYALYENYSGNSNTAVGTNAMTNNIDGNYNAALGSLALYYNSSGISNTASGSTSLYSNTTGSFNSAFGTSSLIYNTTGNYNTAAGADALFYNITGSENTAVGLGTLFYDTTGSYNTAIGTTSLPMNTNGNYNAALGRQAMYGNTSGSYNTAIGTNALYSNTTGKFNTAIGDSAGVLTGNLKNATAVGYYAIVNASNKVVIGNSNVTNIGGYAAWTNYSDIRFKENIFYQDRLGLNFINKLHTVSYTYKADKNKRHRDGLIAQDVQQTLNDLGIEFSGLVVDSDSAKTLNLSYSEFVLPLINSVQELSRQNEELKKEIMEIKSMLKQKSLELNK